MVEKEIEVCDFCGNEVDSFKNYCECDICGKHICKTCATKIYVYKRKNILICQDCKDVDLSEYIKIQKEWHHLSVLQDRVMYKGIRIMDKIREENK